MSINNIACFKAEGEVTIKFAGEVTFHANTSPPSTAPQAPGGPPPPPADGATPPPADGATPPSPGGQDPPRHDDAAAPTEQSVRDETVDAAQNLMNRVCQTEADRAAIELGRVNRRAHEEIQQVQERIARLEQGDTSHSLLH